MGPFLFYAREVAVLAAVLLTAAAAGTFAAGDREPLSLRCALGLALLGEGLFALAALHLLRPLPVALFLITVIIGGLVRWSWRLRVERRWLLVGVTLALPEFLVALHPPLAFDETLYHLPFVRALATEGALRFHPELRFPVFPQLHELLCVAPYVFAGDVATHLVALVELLVTVGLLAGWAGKYDVRAAPLAAALFIGSPIVIYLGTITHVDAALTLFIAAGFFALDVALGKNGRASLVTSGVFFGTACSVKYLGGFFALVAFAVVVAVRRRDAIWFVLATVAAAMPTTLWLVSATGNPVFPFATSLFGASEWSLQTASPHSSRLIDALRLVWDVSFDRARVNGEPPVTPLLIVMIAAIAAAAIRNGRARFVLVLCVAFASVFVYLPRDTRYLVPLLPVVCVASAVVIATRFPRLAAVATGIALVPASMYLGWRLRVMGLPPATEAAREQELVRRIDGYQALGRAASNAIYVCGAEQLQYYATGRLEGDFNGPDRYDLVLRGKARDIAERLRRREIGRLLAVRSHCRVPDLRPAFDLAYDDGKAQLWRVKSAAR